MEITVSSSRRTIKNNTAVCGAKVTLPVISGVKAEKRINGLIEKCKEGFFEYAEKHASSDGMIFSLCGTVKLCNEKICSIFFEKTCRIGRNTVTYQPFSLTLDLNSGRALPLCAIDKAFFKSKRTYCRRAMEKGVKLTPSALMRRYYLTDGGIVVYSGKCSCYIDV